MDESASSLHVDLEDLRWLRGLARRLVHDPHLAEDAVQETVLTALTRRPREVRSLRAWLSSVLRNEVRQEQRGRARRAAREAERPLRDTAPSTLEVVEELAWHRRLVELVHALDEPYRSTIVLRFLRSRSPREIARALDVPVKTVHTRIERGLARLRERLDAQHGGDRRSWAIALLPLTHKPAGALGLAASAMVIPMTAKLLAAGVVVAVLTLPFVLSSESDAPADLPPAAPTANAQANVEPEPESESSQPQRSAVRSEVAVAAPVPAPEAVIEAPPLLRGLVRSVDGLPVGGVQLVFQPMEELESAADVGAATAAPDGSFSLPLPDVAGRLDVDDPLWASVVRPHLDGSPPVETPIVVVAPSRHYAGRVVDTEGLPVEGARVWISLAETFSVSLEIDGRVVHVRVPMAEASTDDRGEFRFEGVGRLEGALIGAARDGYAEVESALPVDSAHDLLLTLGAAQVERRAIWGRVFDPDGSPVASASVSTGWHSVRTGADGRFVLEPAEWFEEGQLRAVKPGVGAVEQPFAWAEARVGLREDDPIELRLAAPLILRGRVVDAEGEPVAGALVWTPDTTHLGQVELARNGVTTLGFTTVEARLVGAPLMEFTVDAITDASGAFELKGLLPRAYELFAIEPHTLAAAGPVVANPERGEARLQLGSHKPRRIAGRLVSRKGMPLAGARVSLGRALPWERPVRIVDPWAGSPMTPPDASRLLRERSAWTDDEGRFAFEGIEARGTFLAFDGPPVFSLRSHALSDVADLESFEITVDARCHFRLSLLDPSEADEFALQDAEGGFVPLFYDVEDATISAAGVDLVDGRSGPASTQEGRHVVVLRRGGREVRRVGVEFPAGGPHVLGL